MEKVDPAIRFWAKVEKTERCWIWIGALRNNYGRFGLTPKVIVQAHRFAFENLIGPIPEGLHLDHLCRNTRCVNPDHLEPVTSKTNTQRGKAGTKDAIKTHCPKGHPYEGDNLEFHLSEGKRRCRTCRNEQARARYAVKRGGGRR